MYKPFENLALRVLKAPSEPPDPPAGSHDSIEISRASPKFLRYRLLGFWIGFSIAWIALWIVALIVAFEGDPVALFPIVLVGWAMLALQFFLYFVLRIDYSLRYYIVTDRSLRVREGAVIVKELTISHANVQNIRVVQGPLERVFGIQNLLVDTAGGAGGGTSELGGKGHSIRMAGIENAHEVRNGILAHLKKHGGGAGLGDDDDEDARGGVLATPELMDALRGMQTAARELRHAAAS